jgi:hypothetical protein
MSHQVASVEPLTSHAMVQTHIKVRLECIFNQLVFNHALRTRVNTASADLEKKKKTTRGKNEGMTEPLAQPASSNVSPPIETADTSEEGESSTTIELAKVAVPASSPSGTTSVSTSTSTPTAQVDKKPETGAGAGDGALSKQASAQAGSISNLVTVNALNLTSLLDGTAFTSPIKGFAAFVFLYRILGWRYTVSLFRH